MIGHRQHGFQAAQHAVGAPIAGELNGRPHQVPLVLFQLGLKALKQREGVGCGPGKTRQHLAMVQLAHLACGAFDHDVAQRDLTVAADGDLNALRRLAAHTNDGGSVK